MNKERKEKKKLMPAEAFIVLFKIIINLDDYFNPPWMNDPWDRRPFPWL